MVKEEIKKSGFKRVEKKVGDLRAQTVSGLNFDKAGKEAERFGHGVFKSVVRPFRPDKRKLTLGQRTADWLTSWAGSWFFIIGFLVFLVLWMTVNTVWIVFGEAWDKYPFILLNLVLSCLAAIQAPVILMSQNRTSQKDRLRTEYDYQVNRKAEKEIQEIKRQLDRIEKRLKR